MLDTIAEYLETSKALFKDYDAEGELLIFPIRKY